MKNLKECKMYQENSVIVIENMEGKQYTLYDNELDDILPEAFYEHVQDKMSDFYKN